MTPEVVLYGRPGCHLCDEARSVIAAAQARHAFTFSERDIESDDALFAAYLERIPVITIDGAEAFELFVDATELSQRLGYSEAR